MCFRLPYRAGLLDALTSRPPLIEIQIWVLIFRKSSLGNLKLNKYMGLIQNFPLRRLVKIATHLCTWPYGENGKKSRVSQLITYSFGAKVKFEMICKKSWL
jgi:hypothetical protein